MTDLHSPVAEPEAQRSLGNRLRLLREEQGLSLDDVSLATRVSLGNLRAIEAETYDRLPADSFAMLGCAGGLRLERYLERQPPSTVLALEHALAAPFALIPGAGHASPVQQPAAVARLVAAAVSGDAAHG